MPSGRFINRTGQKFGHLTVIKRITEIGSPNSQWECECECGNVAIVYGRKLSNGDATMCTKFCSLGNKDLTNKKFGEWTVLEKTSERGQGRIKWKCQCSCGTISVVLPQSLYSGRTTKCTNCYAKTRQLAPGVTGKKRFLYSYKNGAKNRNYSWELTDEQAFALSALNCHYCNLEPSQIWTSGLSTEARENGKFIGSGIDRKDNTKGYTIENSVPCCKLCNWAKSDLTLEEFIKWINQLAQHRGSCVFK